MLDLMWYRQLTTPAAVIDLEVLERNARTMAQRAARLGVRLRPHVKTHKCVEAARIQVQELGGHDAGHGAGETVGITVSTLAEAHHFAAAGFADITYAVPMAPCRIGDASHLARQVDRLALLVDHPRTISILEAFAGEHDTRFTLLLKVDCGGGRAGVAADDPASQALARRLYDSPHFDFAGILTHAGQAYACRNRAEIARVAAHERQVMTRLAAHLVQAGVPVPQISIGSTPTLVVADDLDRTELDGITEVRPGNYLFFDAHQAAIGCCALADVAFTVLTSVIGSYPDRGELVIDAGALALSKDPGPTHVDPACGFGVLLSADGRRRLDSLRLVSLSQEHAVVSCTGAAEARRFPPGALLRVIPNHSCLAAALFDRYQVLHDDTIVDEWHPVRGW